MRLIMKYYSGDEFEGSELILPFEYSSKEDAEYDFLVLLEECRKNYDWMHQWYKDNCPYGKHKCTPEKIEKYLEEHLRLVETGLYKGYFHFLTEEFSYNIQDGGVEFYTLDEWFENNKLN